jgi:hypothetical protein
MSKLQFFTKFTEAKLLLIPRHRRQSLFRGFIHLA